MPKFIFSISAIILILLFSSCETVVDIDLETSQERLVVEAFIKWEKGTAGNEQLIKLQKTTSFFDGEIIPATGTQVTISNENGTTFTFSETDPGFYETTTFVPEFGASYTLSINYNNEVYESTETFFPVPEIDEVTQSIDEGFSTEDPEVNVFFTDFAGTEDFYRIFFFQNRIIDGVEEPFDMENFTYDDSFEDGSQLSDFFESELIEIGDIFNVEVYGISEAFNNYIYLIRTQADADIGPFATPPVNVKGNLKNITTEANYPYGYFSLMEFDSETLIFQ